jgi:hypothetical protein
VQAFVWQGFGGSRFNLENEERLSRFLEQQVRQGLGIWNLEFMVGLQWGAGLCVAGVAMFEYYVK